MNPFMDRAEIVLWVRHANGGGSARTIWVVVLDGDAYVHSAFGRRSVWCRRVLRLADTQVEVAGVRLSVTFQPVDDPGLVRRVSGAYRVTYGVSRPGPVESMNGHEAAATTMRLTNVGQLSQLPA
ncbi:DUF2255 family protein [Streptomyces javensis]|uniref:DUF2255 family protein n=1 Tax=Streptomyces javensis TaxID=114698 RepID=UPI0033C6057B